MRITTYNILNPYLAVKWGTIEGYNPYLGKRVDNWPTRKHSVLSNLITSEFSIACIQEASKATLEDLKAKSFSIVAFSPHQADFETESHGVAIAYNPEKVILIAKKIFHSLGDEVKYRGEIYADFQDKATGQKFRVASTHLIGYNIHEQDLETKQQSKLTGLNQLKNVIKEIENNVDGIDHLVICGDFNEDVGEMYYTDSRQNYLLELGYRYDGSVISTEKRTNRKIDWIFHKSLNHRRLNLYPFNHDYQNMTASDHRMIGTDFFS